MRRGGTAGGRRASRHRSHERLGGFAWGNGPAWDSVLFNLPYTVWRLRGDTRAIAVTADAMLRYLAYIRTRRSADGTVAIGLGDWVPVGKKPNRYDTPLVLTDSIMVTDMANKATVMLDVIEKKTPPSLRHCGMKCWQASAGCFLTKPPEGLQTERRPRRQWGFITASSCRKRGGKHSDF